MAREYRVENFVYASSSSVYGKNKNNPYSVEDRVDNPICLYAATKKANELMAHAYSHLYEIPCTGLDFSPFMGPGAGRTWRFFSLRMRSFTTDPINVYNYGDMRRDFTYIDDIVAGTVSAIERPVPYEIFNLGNSDSTSLMDFIGAIESELGQKAEKNMLPMQPGDVAETSADITKSREILGFSPKTPLEEGIQSFYCLVSGILLVFKTYLPSKEWR